MKKARGNSVLTPPLPMYPDEMRRLGWESLDVLIVTGDAYVDHPAFGAAMVGRCLESLGIRVGIIAQPRWDTVEDICRLGPPRLFVGVTAGALDSMLAHYTAFRKLRRDDAYTPGNQHGARPNRAAIVYAGLARRAFPGVPVVLGGVEASMRRATHYDFWSDRIRRSILLDSKADLLVYGMGERAVAEIAARLQAARDARETDSQVLHGIPGTVFVVSKLSQARDKGVLPDEADMRRLPSHEEILEHPRALMTATLAFERQMLQGREWLVQAVGGRQVVFCPPAAPLSTREMDVLYQLPFTRRPHPVYRLPITAAEMAQFSMTAHRGCAAGCTFCAITMHQGRCIQSRSATSLCEELRVMTEHPDWKGSVSDVGGPTANMWGARCAADPAQCQRPDCLFPKRCPHFKSNTDAYVTLLRELQRLPGVKHLRVASGIRHDMDEGDGAWMRALVAEFVGGQLKAAPEHSCDHVLRLMRKPSLKRFESFLALFAEASREAGKEQYVIPYLISAFPGCTDADMRALAQWLARRGWRPQQVQCFIPTPGTVATAMYHVGEDTRGNPLYVARRDSERLRQHRILTSPAKSSRLR